MSKELASGFFAKVPHERAPDFVKMKVSIRLEDFEETMRRFGSDGWLNIDVLESRSGKLYGQIDDWKPSERTGGPVRADAMFPKDEADDIPF